MKTNNSTITLSGREMLTHAFTAMSTLLFLAAGLVAIGF
jgi:hypothetical protein